MAAAYSRTYWPQSLDELMGMDPHNLLAAERLPKLGHTVSRAERISARHRDIYNFIHRHGRLPAADAAERAERSMASRLGSLRTTNPIDYQLCMELVASGTEAAAQLEQMAPGLSISRDPAPQTEQIPPLAQRDGQPPSGQPQAPAAAASDATAAGRPAAQGDAAVRSAMTAEHSGGSDGVTAPLADDGSGAARPGSEPEAAADDEDVDRFFEELGSEPAVVDEEQVFEDIEDLINNDPLGLLKGLAAAPPDDSRWRESRELRPAGGRRSLDDIIARAEPCPGFYRYQRFFDEIALQLQQGTLGMQEIVGTSGKIDVGDIFVLGGVTAIVAGGEATVGAYKDTSRSYRKERWRLDLIYDNGKQSNLTSETLRASFYKKQLCLRVVPASPAGSEYLEGFRHELQQLRSGRGGRVASGCVYILASESTDPELLKFTANSSLVKVGATTTSVEQRIVHAEQEDTYLFAKVRLIAQFTCYDTDPFELERIVHAFLSPQRLNVELRDGSGRTYRPREWFTVSADTVREVVRHVIDKDLHRYRIDPVRGKLRLKTGA